MQHTILSSVPAHDDVHGGDDLLSHWTRQAGSVGGGMGLYSNMINNLLHKINVKANID